MPGESGDNNNLEETQGEARYEIESREPIGRDGKKSYSSGARGGVTGDVRASLAHTTHRAEFNQVRLVSWQVRRRNSRGRSVSKKTRDHSEKATQGKATRHSIAQCYAVPLSIILKYFIQGRNQKLIPKVIRSFKHLQYLLFSSEGSSMTGPPRSQLLFK